MPNGKCQLHGPLSSAERARLEPSQFALPSERKYPILDVSHARNAKSRASQQLARGNLTKAQHAQIVQRSNKVIRQCGGDPSPAKGKPVQTNEEHGMWSSNPGTGWYIVAGVVGAALIGTGVGIYYYKKRLPPASEMKGPRTAAKVCENYRGHTYCLYQDESQAHSDFFYWAIDAGAVSEEYAKKDDAHREAKAVIDTLPPLPPIPGDIGDDPGPPPVPIVEPDEPQAFAEGDEAPPGTLQFDEAPPPPLVRKGLRVRIPERSIEVSNRDQWEQYAPGVIASLNPDVWPAVDILDRLFADLFPEIPGELSQLVGWEINGQPYGSVVASVQQFQDRVNQNNVTFPMNVQPAELLALAAIGEVPPEYIVGALDLGTPNQWELWERHNQYGVFPVVLRYREERLPDQTDRYWQWLMWQPGEYQLRTQNATNSGRKSGKKQARAEVFELIDNMVIAVAQMA